MAARMASHCLVLRGRLACADAGATCGGDRTRGVLLVAKVARQLLRLLRLGLVLQRS